MHKNPNRRIRGSQRSFAKADGRAVQETGTFDRRRCEDKTRSGVSRGFGPGQSIDRKGERFVRGNRNIARDGLLDIVGEDFKENRVVAHDGIGTSPNGFVINSLVPEGAKNENIVVSLIAHESIGFCQVDGIFACARLGSGEHHAINTESGIQDAPGGNVADTDQETRLAVHRHVSGRHLADQKVKRSVLDHRQIGTRFILRIGGRNAHRENVVTHDGRPAISEVVIADQGPHRRFNGEIIEGSAGKGSRSRDRDFELALTRPGSGHDSRNRIGGFDESAVGGDHPEGDDRVIGSG